MLYRDDEITFDGSRPLTLTSVGPGGGLETPYDARLGAAAGKVLPYALLAVLPAAAVIFMFVVAVDTGPLAWDFRNELYPQAKGLAEGTNPYPQALWPPLAAAVAMPFTILPSEAAGVVFAMAGLACVAFSLWLVGVRDWRVYGAVGLWPPVLTDIRIAHLTPILCLLAAIVWRYRDRPLVSGGALGLACGLKFLLWPLGIWLLATRRARATLIAAGIGVVSLLLVVPFAPVAEYLRTVRAVADRFDQDSYSTYGMLSRLGMSSVSAHLVTYAVGVALLGFVWRYRSFALAIGAALVLSPIVWLDFYALAAIPLAVGRPRLSAVWLLPLLTWGLPSSGIGADAVWGVGRVLVIFVAVLWTAARAESDLGLTAASNPRA